MYMKVGGGHCPQRWSSWNMKFTAHLHLMLGLRISSTIIPPPSLWGEGHHFYKVYVKPGRDDCVPRLSWKLCCSRVAAEQDHPSQTSHKSSQTKSIPQQGGKKGSLGVSNLKIKAWPSRLGVGQDTDNLCGEIQRKCIVLQDCSAPSVNNLKTKFVLVMRFYVWLWKDGSHWH